MARARAGGSATRSWCPAGRERRLLIAVAGSDRGGADARRELRKALDGADDSFRAKLESRRKLERYTQLSLPGDPLLAQGIDWSKQNLADSVQVAEGLQVREVREGKQYPPPSGTVPHVRFFGAGWPDYPWMFATDGEYTAFAAVALGQFEPAMDHLRGLRDVSRVANGETGKVVHEVMTEGSIYFGANEDPGNTDETVKFPSAVALLWRWTGDDRFRDEMYDFTVDGMRWALSTLDADGDGWLEGPGNVERPGMGEEKLDVAVYTIRGLRDLADMARSRGDRATAVLGARAGARARAALRGRVVDAGGPAARRLARRSRQREAPAAPLDRRGPDGGGARARRPHRPRPRHLPARRGGARAAREALLQRRLRPLPHRRARAATCRAGRASARSSRSTRR